MTAGPDARLSRLLDLVPWLSARPGVLLSEAASHFGVSEDQLRADLDMLLMCGLPPRGFLELIDLDIVPGPDGDTITIVDAQGLDRPLTLTGSEAIALQVAAEAIADVPGMERNDALERALKKLRDAIGEVEGAPVSVDLGARVRDPSVLATVQGAIQNGRRLHLAYRNDARDEVTERDVDGLRTFVREGNFYLEGWCYRAGAPRSFRVDRIEQAVELDIASDPPAEADVLQTRDGVFEPSDGDLRIVLDLVPAARWATEYYPVEEVTERPDGSLRVVLRSRDVDFARRLVLRLSGAATVIEPDVLAASVQEAASQALAAYSR